MTYIGKKSRKETGAMREIKFRAWDKINKKMEEVDGYNLYIADGRMFEIYEASYAYETYMRKNDVTDKFKWMAK